jgi:hypothetical protein
MYVFMYVHPNIQSINDVDFWLLQVSVGTFFTNLVSNFRLASKLVSLNNIWDLVSI